MKNEIRVLHVDDEPDVAELAAIYLQRETDRISVETATSASEALTTLSQTEFDCIISDYDMPGQNGLEFLQAMGEADYELPFILFTGKGSEEVASDAIAAGVTDYLQKGSGTEQYELLANRITNAVEQYRSAQQAANLERIRRVVRDVNRELVRAETRGEIERRVCQIISDAEPYLFAWIGEHDPDSQTITPSTAAGIEKGYLDTIQITTDEQSTGRGPTGKAVRNRALAVVQDISENATYTPWRADALERGYQSSAAIPIVHEDTLYGILNVYADRTNAFDSDEQELLEELADDTAHALYRSESRDRLRTYGYLVENLPVGVFRATPGANGEVINANPAFAEILNVDSPTHLEGRSVSSFYRYPAERNALSEELRQTGFVEGKEQRLETEDGEDICVSVTAIQTAENGETYFDGIVQDITESKERERDLRLFREAVEASGHSIYFTDAAGSIEYVNPAFEETTGYTAEEVLGLNPRVLKSGEHDQEFYEQLWTTIVSGETWRNELINSTKSGERYVVDQTIAPVEGVSGEIEHFVAVNADVTQEKEREEKLIEMQQWLTAIFEHTTTPMFMKEDTGEYVFVNQEYRDLFGFRGADIIGRDDYDIHSPEMAADLKKNDRAVIERGKPIKAEEQILVDGEQRVFLSQKVPVYDTGEYANSEEPVAVFCVAMDITERKNREQQLQRERDRLDKFASIVSHDLRNPLNVTQGRLELASEECESEHFEPLGDALSRMERIIDDVLWLAREGKDIGTTEQVDLRGATDAAWAIVADGIDDAELVYTAGGHQTTEADYDRVCQLFENLLRNAIEHGGDGVSVTVGELDNGFYIEDDGPGISEKDREHVFGAGYSTSERGTGFGLNIVKQVVESHDWEINVTESSQGGARFEITGVEITE